MRMLCTDCLELSVPETLLPGSDFAELVAWCCFGLPGLVYCGWRHLQRVKACAHCGSPQLMREARASAARRLPDAPPTFAPPVRNTTGPVSWPAALATPRARLRRGALGAGFLTAALAAFLLGTLEVVPPRLAFAGMLAATGATLLWLVRHAFQLARTRNVRAHCQAWDDHGRTLRIEPI